jgi:hypothetical protein
MKNPHRDSNFKRFAILALSIGALAYYFVMNWYYWPHLWPRGPSSSWQWWDWLWVTLFLGAAPFAIIYRIRLWQSRIDLMENTRMRKGASKPKPADRDESDGSW